MRRGGMRMISCEKAWGAKRLMGFVVDGKVVEKA